MPPGDRNILPGTLELLVLRALRDAPAHGFAVSKDIRKRSQGVVDLNDGTIYQALHRLENDGLVESQWGHSQTGKRAKFYVLTAAGLSRLGKEARAWHRFVQAVSHILGPEYAGADAAPAGPERVL